MQSTRHESVKHSARSGLAILAAIAGFASPMTVQAQDFVEYEAKNDSQGYQTSAPTNGVSDQTHYCALTGMKGYFGDHDRDGGREWVGLLHNAGLIKISHGSGRVGRMSCVKWTNFTRPAGGGSWWSTPATGLSITNANSDTSRSANLWAGDAASMIEEVAGEFESHNDYVRITQSTSATTSNTFKISSHSGDLFSSTDMYAYARSMFVGNPDNRWLLRFIGYTPGVEGRARGMVGSIATSEMSVGSDSGYSTYWMADSGKTPVGGLCYFTKISGDFNGTGDSVLITSVNGIWRLTATSGSGNTKASSRCMAYDQR